MSSTDPKIEQKTDEGEGYQFLSEKDVAPFTKAEVTRSLMMCQTTLAETNAQAQQVELSRDSYYRKLGREQTAHREALQAAETAQKSLEAAVKAQKAAELQAATAVGTNADLKAQKKAADEKVSKPTSVKCDDTHDTCRCWCARCKRHGDVGAQCGQRSSALELQHRVAEPAHVPGRCQWADGS